MTARFASRICAMFGRRWPSLSAAGAPRLSYSEISPHRAMRAPTLSRVRIWSKIRPADVLEIDVDPAGCRSLELVTPISALVVDAGVEAKPADNVVALVGRARDTYHARPDGLADLAGNRPDRSGGCRHHHRLAGSRLADVVYTEVRP